MTAVVAVCAVAPSAGALAGQTRAPEETVLAAPGPEGLRRAVAAAAQTGAEWLWLLDAGVHAEADALAELLAPLEWLEALGDPALLSSKVIGHDGRLDPGAPPWPRLLARELAMAGADHRLAALRGARYGSLLVHRRAVEAHGPPRADFSPEGGDLEWTGRVLRDEPGYLAPRSVVVREPVARDPRRFTAERVRILRGDGWRGQEKAWFAFLLAQDLSREVAARPASAPGFARAIGRGLRARA